MAHCACTLDRIHVPFSDGVYDCYVFQDADLLLENDHCLYSCHDANPRHLAMYIDKYSYEALQYRVLCSKYKGIKDNIDLHVIVVSYCKRVSVNTYLLYTLIDCAMDGANARFTFGLGVNSTI